MNLYNNRIYIEFKKAYYVLLDIFFAKSGMPVTINGFVFRFLPKYYKWVPINYEKDAFEFIKKYLVPGGVCVDIGANFGLYSILFSKYYNCNVYSFEPTKSTVEILSKNIKYNSVEDKVTVIPKAVYSKDGKLYFNVQDTEGSVANSLVDYYHSDEYKAKVEVDVVALDSYFKEIKYDFLKIDAEGSEYDVLLGAKETIRKYKPRIILDLHPAPIKVNGHSLENIWNFLENEGYLCFFENKKIIKEDFCSRDKMFDVVLLHKSLNPKNILTRIN